MTELTCASRCSMSPYARTNIFKRMVHIVLSLMIFRGFWLPTGLAASPLAGEDMAQEAARLREQGEYSLAIERCAQAIPLLMEKGNVEQAAACSQLMQDMDIIMQMHPHTLEEATALIRKTYPQATRDNIALWISSDFVNRWFYNGETHYDADVAANLSYRYLDLMLNDDAKRVAYNHLVLDVLAIAQAQPQEAFRQYSKPALYRGTHTLRVSREKLPQQGTLKIWLPIPINTGPQTGVTIESISPEQWLMLPPSIDQEIGLAYFEVPLEELTDDLSIRLAFTFTHYEQHFNVDPDLIGEYDEASALYQKYTQASGNTQITDEIRQKAREIAGEETNAYLVARKLYDNIVENVTYILMPHAAFYPRTDMVESDYVHRLQQGDCGAQSMYFTAMCRALGIPARTTGGWQMFSGEFGGHFWAEFHLPNYGWVPVDTSFGQTAFFSRDVTPQEGKAFVDFCFAHQDSMRCVVQEDTDVSLIPPAQGTVLLPMAIQMPAAEYSVPSCEILTNVIPENWTLSCEKLEGN